MKIPDIIEKVNKSIVRIITEKGSGTGVIIDKKGIILTNHHVVELESAAVVILSCRGESKVVKKEVAKVVYSNPLRDIAFLIIKNDRLISAKLNYSSNIKIGEEIIAIGHPGGEYYDLPYSVTKGILSYPKRFLPEQPEMPYIQFDAATNHGNSGGPIIDLLGKVIGLVTRGVQEKDTKDTEGLYFAIPMWDIHKEISEIRERFQWYKTVKYCYICGFSNNVGKKYCQNCGSTLTLERELEDIIYKTEYLADEIKPCWRCLNILYSRKDTICSFCGAVLDPSKYISKKSIIINNRKHISCPICKLKTNFNTRYCKNCGFDLKRYLRR